MTLTRDISVNSGLRFLQGTIVTDAFKVVAAAGISFIRTNGHVVGNYSQLASTSPVLYPIGTSTSYLPLTLTFSTGATDVTASVAGVNPVVAKGPGIVTNPLVALWSIEPTSFPVGATATAIFQYPDNVRQAAFQQSQAFAARWDNVTNAWQSFLAWSTPSPNEDPSRVTVTNIGQFSDWAIFSGVNNTPLPIVLKYFKASHAGDHVGLEWITLSEKNTDYFGVEKSRDGKTFYPVGELPARENSLEETRYQMVDGEPTPGLSYYRLYEIDLDGTRVDFDLVALHIKQDPYTKFYIIHPNPTPGLIYIKNILPANRLLVTVYDLAGRAMLSRTWYDVGVLETSELDLRDLKSGVYLLHVKRNDETTLLSYKISKY